MKGIREFQKELLVKEYKHAKPGITEQPWGLEMKITDPFNNSVRFSENKE